MTTLTAQQLAFILDIKKVEARAKMCVAWSEELGEPNRAAWVMEKDIQTGFDRKTKKLDDPYPESMSIEVLSRRLNLPTLQAMVDDICSNYLTRSGSKKWILCDYPEKAIKLLNEKGDDKTKLSIPPALRSMLPSETVDTIHSEWRTRYPKYAR